jgi:hypothetical protein
VRRWWPLALLSVVAACGRGGAMSLPDAAVGRADGAASSGLDAPAAETPPDEPAPAGPEAGWEAGPEAPDGPGQACSGLDASACGVDAGGEVGPAACGKSTCQPGEVCLHVRSWTYSPSAPCYPQNPGGGCVDAFGGCMTASGMFGCTKGICVEQEARCTRLPSCSYGTSLKQMGGETVCDCSY